jgi:hypothetical protein
MPGDGIDPFVWPTPPAMDRHEGIRRSRMEESI